MKQFTYIIYDTYVGQGDEGDTVYAVFYFVDLLGELQPSDSIMMVL